MAQPEAFVYAAFGTLQDPDPEYYQRVVSEEAGRLGLQYVVVDLERDKNTIVMFDALENVTADTFKSYSTIIAERGTEDYEALLEVHEG